MRGAASSSLLSKITASFRNGSIRWNGIDGMPPLPSSVERIRGDSRPLWSGPTGVPRRSRARPFDLSRYSTWPG